MVELTPTALLKHALEQFAKPYSLLVILNAHSEHDIFTQVLQKIMTDYINYRLRNERQVGVIGLRGEWSKETEEK